uniref:MAGE domain-containing protein n=1 Tax=Macrostomum lignano TaxID=282301 RepID=A0A1I8FGW7_9PLAT
MPPKPPAPELNYDSLPPNGRTTRPSTRCSKPFKRPRAVDPDSFDRKMKFFGLALLLAFCRRNRIAALSADDLRRLFRRKFPSVGRDYEPECLGAVLHQMLLDQRASLPDRHELVHAGVLRSLIGEDQHLRLIVSLPSLNVCRKREFRSAIWSPCALISLRGGFWCQRLMSDRLPTLQNCADESAISADVATANSILAPCCTPSRLLESEEQQLKLRISAGRDECWTHSRSPEDWFKTSQAAEADFHEAAHEALGEIRDVLDEQRELADALAYSPGAEGLDD